MTNFNRNNRIIWNEVASRRRYLSTSLLLCHILIHTNCFSMFCCCYCCWLCVCVMFFSQLSCLVSNVCIIILMTRFVIYIFFFARLTFELMSDKQTYRAEPLICIVALAYMCRMCHAVCTRSVFFPFVSLWAKFDLKRFWLMHLNHDKGQLL